MMIDEDLLARLDKVSEEINRSRSAIMCDLVERGLQQAYATKRFAGNRHLLRAINWIFGFSGLDADSARKEFDEEDERVNVARELILNELKKVTVISAEKDFEKQFMSVSAEKDVSTEERNEQDVN